jgi:aspartate-semialdehyde dehydrogenase
VAGQKPFHLALAGATGAVGRAVLELLDEEDLALASFRALASEKSAGQEVEHRGDPQRVEAFKPGGFRNADVVILAVPAEAARPLAADARAAGALVVDLSPSFRLEPDVPLVLHALGAAALDGALARGVVASPGATAAHAALALAPLHAAAGLERVELTALQAASAAGKGGVEQLEREAQALMNGVEPEGSGPIPHRIAFNVVPQAGAFGPSGWGEEELRTAAELKRLLGKLDLPVAATVLRVPIFYGHVASLRVRTLRKLGAAEAREVLRRAPGVKLVDAPAERVYPMPMLAVNDASVLVGRVRDDLSGENGLELLAVADNLRTGVAENAIRLAAALAAKR